MKKVLKNCKETRYYYRHRGEILEKKRLSRLARKGIDIKGESNLKLTLEERRKKKMEVQGLLETQK